MLGLAWCTEGTCSAEPICPASSPTAWLSACPPLTSGPCSPAGHCAPHCEGPPAWTRGPSPGCAEPSLWRPLLLSCHPVIWTSLSTLRPSRPWKVGPWLKHQASGPHRACWTIAGAEMAAEGQHPPPREPRSYDRARHTSQVTSCLWQCQELGLWTQRDLTRADKVGIAIALPPAELAAYLDEVTC